MSMFEISVEDCFSAAHQVKGYVGDCADIHGHTYRVLVRIRAKNLDRLGMAMDFRRIKRSLHAITKRLDHKTLNRLTYFKRRNATAEYIAMYIFNEMKKKIRKISAVTVWEGTNSSVSYYGEEK